MAILDAALAPSNGQSVAGAGTKVSTNTIDLLSANNDQGVGHPVRAFANLVAALVGGTSVQAQLIESDSADLSPPTVLASGEVVTTANGSAGTVLLDVRVPNTSKRFIGFQFVTDGAVSAGAVDAHIAVDFDHNRYLPTNTGR